MGDRNTLAPVRTLLMRTALLGAGAAAACWLAAPAAGQAPAFPACPPSTTPLPAPTVTAQSLARDTPSRIIAGRRFSLDYDDTTVAVQDTSSATPGTTFDSPLGDLPTVVVPTPGPAVFTVRYFDINATRAAACVWSAAFTVDVEAGDPVSGRLGAIEGPEPRFPRGGPPRLPARGLLTDGRPLVGLVWNCTGSTGRVPLVADLFVERRLTRPPAEASPAGRLTLDDPCDTRSVVAARAPGALLRFYGGPDPDGERVLTAVVSSPRPARFWLRITQAGRLVAQSRYFVAFRPQNGRFPALYVIAPDAAFEAARCRRPPRGRQEFPLGFRKWSIPPCPR